MRCAFPPLLRFFDTDCDVRHRRARNSLQPRVRGDYRFGASEQTAECFAQLGLVESCGEITMNVSDGALQYVQVISDRRQLFSSHCQDVVADPRSRR